MEVSSAILEELVSLGAYKAAKIPVDKIFFDPSLRKLCEMNSCGCYGKNWTCPPGVGEIDQLIARARSYDTAIVFQTVATLEDSFDWEGMMEASKRHKEITSAITDRMKQALPDGFLQLSAGGCSLCETCAKQDDLPCRFPHKAIASLESYGIHVAKLAEACGMNYINGQNTVTYFGAFLFR